MTYISATIYVERDSHKGIVIGKYRSSDIIFHAWVVWYHDNRIFILDPTHQSSIKELRDFGSGHYRPYYSYYHTVKWRHHL